jgi:hypothetical protein
VDLLWFGTDHAARYLRLEISSTYTYSPTDTFAYAILGEVVLSAAPLDAGLPSLAVALMPNGDAVLTFTGILQSSTNAAAPFNDVLGSPTSPHTVPRDSQAPQQYFRARGN